MVRGPLGPSSVLDQNNRTGPDNLVPESLKQTLIRTIMAVMLNCELREIHAVNAKHELVNVTMVLALKLVLLHFIVNIQ